jgi:hypothetical protein
LNEQFFTAYGGNPVYLAFQPIRFAPVHVTVNRVSSYLTISPFSAETDGIVSVALSVFSVFSRKAFPLGSMALCVAPTFLLVLPNKAIKCAIAVAKVLNLMFFILKSYPTRKLSQSQSFEIEHI